MIVAIIIVVMLWYSLRKRDNSNHWVKELAGRQKVEISYQQSGDITDPKFMNTYTVSYSDLITEINVVYAYQKLVKEYEAGEISSVTFHERTSSLIDEIDIRDILEV